MAVLNDEKLKMMEDEMNRFEAEIALPVLPPPPPPPSASAPRAVIGSNTYNQVQRRLEEQQTGPPMPAMGYSPILPPPVAAFAGIPPPPPPPPPLLIPHQVQRGPPIRHPMRPMGPPGPPMMGGPPPPGFLGPPQMNTRPGPPFMGPPVPMERLPTPLPPPPQPQHIPAVVCATPKIYLAKSSSMDFESGLGDLSDDLNDKKRKKQKGNDLELTRAKDMADRVKASMVVSVGPVGVSSTPEDTPASASGRKKDKKSKKHIRMAGGQTWEDNSLIDWDDDDFRIFCGDLGNDVTDEILTRAFSKYQSFLKAKVIRDKRSNKTKGFGFVSFKDPQDFIKAMKEMNGRYVGSRPIKLRKSTWRARNLETVRKKEKEKAALIGLLTGR